MRWHQPAGFYLLLSSTLWGLVVASHQYGTESLMPPIIAYLLVTMSLTENYFTTPLILVYLVFVIGSLIMRSAGCIINDIWDKDLDPQVTRTQNRPLAQKEVSVKNAFFLFSALILLALTLLLLLNPFVGYLSLAAICGTIIYPLSKRFIVIPQLALGFVFGWGVIMAYAAIANQLSLIAWLLFFANILWIVSYDLQYAICDKADDIGLGINSGALYFNKTTPAVIVILQLIMFGVLLITGLILQAKLFFYIALALGGLLLVYFWFFTRGYTDETKCLISFRNNHWYGWIVLIGLIYV